MVRLGFVGADSVGASATKISLKGSELLISISPQSLNFAGAFDEYLFVRRNSLLTLLLCLIILALLAAPRGLVGSLEKRHPPGILVTEAPKQTTLERQEHWVKDEFRITAVANYSVRARVVRVRSYWLGREAEVSSMDMLLAWGAASDQRVQDSISTSLSDRYFRWRLKEPLAVAASEINEGMANTHLIPANESVGRDLLGILPGDVVELKGYLVDVSATDAWRWTTSVVRNDEGRTAGELMWVEAVSRL